MGKLKVGVVSIYGKPPDYGYDRDEGCSDGYGYGYGYGSGYGSGDGYGSLKETTVGFIALLPRERQAHAKELLCQGAKIAFWKSDKDGRPANGGKGDPVSIGLVQKTSGPLSLCNPGTLHATYRLDKWKGDRIWLVALTGKVAESENKLGALQREILAELTDGKVV